MESSGEEGTPAFFRGKDGSHIADETTILGIDPGYGRIGYGVLLVRANRFFHLGHGVIETDKQAPIPSRLNQIFEDISRLIAHFSPQEAAVETLFFFRNVTTAMNVSEARGVIQLALFRGGVSIAEYTPFQVKQSATGSGKAEKGQVQRVLKMLLHLDATPKPDDAADALAAALCHAHTRQFARHLPSTNHTSQGGS